MATTTLSSFARAGSFNHCNILQLVGVHRRYSSALTSYLVTPQQAHEALSSSTDKHRVVPVSGAWLMPGAQVSGKELFERRRIPGSRFFDVDEIKDKRSKFPHMLPSPVRFAVAMSKLGIRRDDTVIVYDTAEIGLFSAPRVAWTFRVFGHPKVHILNNFALWWQERRPTEEGKPQEKPEETTYDTPELIGDKVAEYEEVKRLVQARSHDVQILDARSPERFAGTMQEPRNGIPSGHMPRAINVPYSRLLFPDSKALLGKNQLRRVLREHHVDPDKPIISTCGTGITAAILDAALEEAGMGDPKSRKLYDGSWTEWATRAERGERLVERTDMVDLDDF